MQYSRLCIIAQRILRWSRILTLLRQLVTFGAVGVLNTAITAVVITILTLMGVPLLAANAVGFACGLANSFIMNRLFTFNSKSTRFALPFIVSFALCYALNILVVITVAQATVAHPIVSQVAGMVTYNISFFVLMKLWVFSNAAE